MKKFAALLAIGIALTSTSCSSYLMSHIRHYPYSFNEESGRMIKRVALAPTNLLSPLPAKLNDRGDAVSRALAAYLTGHGITVISQGEAIKTTWEEEKRKAGGIYNSTDGSLQKDKFADSVKATVQRVCADQSVDAVLFHDIIARRATLDRSVLYWDGVQQNIETDKGFADPFTETFSGGSSALSLRILLIDRKNRLVLRNFAGIEHPFRAVREGTKMNWEIRKDVLTDTVKIDHAIAMGLHPFISYPGYPANPVFSQEE